MNDAAEWSSRLRRSTLTETMPRSTRRLFLATAAALFVAGVAACKRSGASASEGPPKPPRVTDESAGLLLTWIDDKGEFHVEQRAPDVPESARALVRVAGPDDPPGDTIFLADLRKAGPDGAYPVRVATRAELESAALARRSGGAALAAAPASAAPRPSGDAPPSTGGPAVIIYGASWCGPCHQAAAHLKRRGVRFVEKDIEEDAEAAREMRAKLAKAGQRGGSIPVLDVRGRILIGFSAAAVDAALAANP